MIEKTNLILSIIMLVRISSMPAEGDGNLGMRKLLNQAFLRMGNKIDLSMVLKKTTKLLLFPRIIPGIGVHSVRNH